MSLLLDMVRRNSGRADIAIAYLAFVGLGDVCPGQRDMLGFALQLQPGRMPRTF